jgi:hypothetical protein
VPSPPPSSAAAAAWTAASTVAGSACPSSNAFSGEGRQNVWSDRIQR